MSARRMRVISTDEIQFNHKPEKVLLTEKKKGVSQNGQTPSIIGICSYCVLDMSEIKYCSIQSWPRGGLSSLPMVPTTRNLTAPPTPPSKPKFVHKQRTTKHQVYLKNVFLSWKLRTDMLTQKLDKHTTYTSLEFQTLTTHKISNISRANHKT